MARALTIDLELGNRLPRVWRRLRVPADLSLADLHRIIQAAMHWDDVHLHVFDIDGHEYGPEPDEEEISLTWVGEASTITVATALAKSHGRFEYTYDFGSENRVVITSTGETAGGPARIECVDGGGPAFDPAEINTRLAEEFPSTRVAGPAATLEEQLVADLTLLLLLLTAYEEGKGVRVANKTLRLDTLDALSDAGLVVTNKFRKGVQLTDRGIKRAEALLQKVTALVQSSPTE